MPVHFETHARLEDAARALSSARDARFFGGGTLLMRALNEASPWISAVIRCTDPVLKEVRVEGDRISIGAHVTMSAVMANRDLAFLAPAARIRIPMQPGNRSLNLSNAVAVVCYEAWRQHGFACGPDTQRASRAR